MQLLTAALVLGLGANRTAGPGDYDAIAPHLAAGDTLRLAPGRYTRCLHLHDLRGTPDAPIVIRGPEAPEPPAVFLAAGCRGWPHHGGATIRICDSSWVTVRDLELDGQHQDVHGFEAGHCRESVDHLTIEHLFIHDHDANQQIDGISTKVPAWDVTIRWNRVVHAGTGMYLGNSEGDDPFVEGTIEDNEVVDPIGYDIQVKHQNALPRIPGLPLGPTVTSILRNVLIKASGASKGEDARPSLLVGHQPVTGPGAGDRFEIAGNVLFENATDQEPLFQGEGNLSFHDNLLVSTHRGPGVDIRPHNDLPREVAIAHNTIWVTGTAIRVRGCDLGANQVVDDNAVFAGTVDPIRMECGVAWDNRVRPFWEAPEGMVNPVPALRRGSGRWASARAGPGDTTPIPGVRRDVWFIDR